MKLLRYKLNLLFIEYRITKYRIQNTKFKNRMTRWLCCQNIKKDQWCVWWMYDKINIEMLTTHMYEKTSKSFLCIQTQNSHNFKRILGRFCRTNPSFHHKVFSHDKLIMVGTKDDKKLLDLLRQKWSFLLIICELSRFHISGKVRLRDSTAGAPFMYRFGAQPS